MSVTSREEGVFITSPHVLNNGDVIIDKIAKGTLDFVSGFESVSRDYMKLTNVDPALQVCRFNHRGIKKLFVLTQSFNLIAYSELNPDGIIVLEHVKKILSVNDTMRYIAITTLQDELKFLRITSESNYELIETLVDSVKSIQSSNFIITTSNEMLYANVNDLLDGGGMVAHRYIFDNGIVVKSSRFILTGSNSIYYLNGLDAIFLASFKYQIKDMLALPGSILTIDSDGKLIKYDLEENADVTIKSHRVLPGENRSKFIKIGLYNFIEDQDGSIVSVKTLQRLDFPYRLLDPEVFLTNYMRRMRTTKSARSIQT